MTASPEGERRLRSVVRTVMSPGIWLSLTLQLLAALLLQLPEPATASLGVTAARIVPTVAALFAFMYVQGGAYAALARGRDALSVREAIIAGRAVFGSFVWLLIKASLVLFVALNALVFLATAATGQGVKVLATRLAPWAEPAIGLLGFALVYWMPVVFRRGNFQLWTSVRIALSIARQRLPCAGYVAVLTLAPAAVFTLLPASTPTWLLLSLLLFGGLMGWLAYVYGVEVLQVGDEIPDCAPC